MTQLLRLFLQLCRCPPIYTALSMNTNLAVTIKMMCWECSISRETVQNRKVAGQLSSRIPLEKRKDLSPKEYSTTHGKGDNSHLTTIIPTPWPAESSASTDSLFS
jgi:hypothetical protein